MFRLIIAPLVLAPAFIGFGLHLLKTFGMFDAILQAEYQRHRDAWNADGRPQGFFWRTSAATEIMGLTRLHLLHQWMRATSEWAVKDEDASRLFDNYQRVARYRWNWMVACMASVTIAGIAMSFL